MSSHAAASSPASIFTGGRLETVSCRLSPGNGDPAAGIVAGLLETGMSEEENEPALGRRYSPLRMGAASFLLPGLGQQRMGRTLRSKIFFSLEGLAWISVGSFLWQGYERENAYQDYAMAFAGVTGTGHSDDYYETIGEFMSNEGRGGYNEFVRREARDLYYPDRDAMEQYYDANKIDEGMGWRWETEGAFDRYNVLRDGSRSSYRRALYAGMFALALRIVSSVDAVRLARTSSSPDKGEGGGISLDIERKRGGFCVSLKRAF